MKNITLNRRNNGSTETLTRISKQAAEKLYLQGKRVYICPVKLSPVSPWQPGAEICRKYHSIITDNAAPEYWQKLIQEATYYNCGAEAGYYLSYYKITDYAGRIL